MDTAPWPYALRLSNEIDNPTVCNKFFNSRIEDFANVEVRPKLKHFHQFRCPAYVLTTHKKMKSKWDTRAKVGIYIGTSPKHARTVQLGLNPCTGLVLPQFHFRIDDLFHTTNNIQVSIEWKEKRHFKLTLTHKERQNTIATDDKEILHASNAFNKHIEPIPNNEGAEPMPVVVTTQVTNDQPAQSKYGHEFKPTKRYTEAYDNLQ
jgi:hypothetical protein